MLRVVSIGLLFKLIEAAATDGFGNLSDDQNAVSRFTGCTLQDLATGEDRFAGTAATLQDKEPVFVEEQR